MYEKFLDKSLNSTRQTVDDTFIAKYANAVSEKLSNFGKKLDLERFVMDCSELLTPINIRQ